MHVLQGTAYYKALRFHLLVDAAIVTHLLKDALSDSELKYMETYLTNLREVKPGSEKSNETIKNFEAQLEERLDILKKSGRTAALWVQYHELVSAIKVYIKAERTHDYKLHLACLTDMLATFAGTGHSHYAKGCRLQLELVSK